MSVRVYIDGFNLYNRMLRRAYPQYKWLDPVRFAERLSPNRHVDHVHYFTARVKGFGGRDKSVLNQQIYLRAISQQDKLSIHYGQFSRHKKWMRRTADHHDEPFVQVWRSEEKGSDVNLAACLLADAFQNRVKTAIVVSNDSDFAESIRIARIEAGIRVVVYSPQYDKLSKELRAVSDGLYPIRPSYLKSSQLPKVVQGKKKPIYPPKDWIATRDGYAALIRACRIIGRHHS